MDSDQADVGRFENTDRMQPTNPFVSSNMPPPIPPKPKKFSRNVTDINRQGLVHRPPLASPHPVVEQEESNFGSANKRKLTLNLHAQSSSSPSTSFPYNCSEEENSSANPSGCKSPKIMTPGHRRMWSPVICTICMEDLFCYAESDLSSYSKESGQRNSENESSIFHESRPQPDTIRPTVSTRCGHLFHTECINKWFVENKEKELKECPFCKREMMANDTTRIFPIFGDD